MTLENSVQEKDKKNLEKDGKEERGKVSLRKKLGKWLLVASAAAMMSTTGTANTGCSLIVGEKTDFEVIDSGGSNTDSDSDSDTDTHVDAGPNTDTDTDSDSDTDSDTDTDTDSDSDTDTDTDTDTDSDTDTDTDSDSDTDTDTDTDTDSDTDTDTDSDTEADGGVPDGGEVDAGPEICESAEPGFFDGLIATDAPETVGGYKFLYKGENVDGNAVFDILCAETDAVVAADTVFPEGEITTLPVPADGMQIHLECFTAGSFAANVEITVESV